MIIILNYFIVAAVQFLQSVIAQKRIQCRYEAVSTCF